MSTDQRQRVKVRMTKTGSLFGRMPDGATFVVTAPREITDFEEARIWAYRSLKRERPDENPMQWSATEETRHVD
jgi:hypothetical protein